MIICMMTTVSHLHRAKAMARSAKRHHPQAKVVVCLVEKQVHSAARHYRLFDHIVLAKDLEIPNFNQFILTRKIHEASYALKGHFLKYLFKKFPSENRLIYLDTDIEILGPFAEVKQALERHPIVLTPHEINQTKESYLFHGIFNIGFIALKRSEESSRFLNWWIHRTDRYCFDDYLSKGIFYEQNWLNAAPALFDVHILDHPGYNVAFWNLKERKRIAVSKKKQYTIEGVPMRFFHFSHASDWLLGAIKENIPKRQKGMYMLRAKYLNELKKLGQKKWSKAAWSYDFHHNGKKITKEDRLRLKQAEISDLEPVETKHKHHDSLTIVQVLSNAPGTQPLPPTNQGGTEKIAYDLTEGLVQLGHKVYLYAAEGSKSSASVIAYPRNLKDSGIAAYVARTLPSGVNLIHDHTFGAELSRRKWSVPIVTTHHVPKSNRTKFAGKNKGTFVPHGIHPGEYECSEEKQDYLLYMGRSVEKKGILRAIDVAEKTNHRLIIAGPLKDQKLFRTEMKPRIAKNSNIEYVGAAGGERKLSLLKHAQCVLFPSDWEESAGRVMIESMACGTPVLCLAKGAVPEVLNGFPDLVCRNVGEMIRKVQDRNFPAPKQLRSYVEEQFSNDRVLGGYLGVYERKIRTAGDNLKTPIGRRIGKKTNKKASRKAAMAKRIARPTLGRMRRKGISQPARRRLHHPRPKKKAA